MDFNQHSYVIVTYPSYEMAVLTFDRLIMAGFSPANVSIVGKVLIQHPCRDAIQTEQAAGQTLTKVFTKVFVSGGNSLKVGWRIGSILGGTIGILLGHSVSSLPGVDGIMLLSKIIFALSSGFFCFVSGGILGTLILWRISQKQVKAWNQRLTQGDYLLVMYGSTDEMSRAKRLLIDFFEKKFSSEY